VNAELIAVGSELLRSGRRDTNGDWLSERLGRHGIDVGVRVMVDDNTERIAAQCRLALGRADVVLVTGGLGPTVDDRTRTALALALDLPLETDADQLERLRGWYERRALPMGPSQAAMARAPRGAVYLENPVGSAPGLRVSQDGHLLFALPGVPAEMKAMFQAGVLPELARSCERTFARRVLKIAGRMESSVDRRIQDLYATEGIELTILAGSSQIELHLRAEGQDDGEARHRLDALDDRITERLGHDVLGRDDETLPEVVGRMLVSRGATVATAESCTAGLLAATLTRAAGSSAWFRGGLVVYDNELKQALAGVRAATLAEHGAVSEAVARELAHAARRRCAATFGIGITGIAGPGGGSAERPIGRVHLALEGPAYSEHRPLQLVGDRDQIRNRTVSVALDTLRRRLLDTETGG